MKRFEVYKDTNENWHPSYVMNCRDIVKVNLIEFIGGYGWRVCVWGAGDYGMECDFELNQYDQALQCFLNVIELKFVTRSALKEFGFITA